MTFNVQVFSDRPFKLGEGPHWDATSKKLYFVDILNGIAATIDSKRNYQQLLKEDKFVTAVLPVQGEPNIAVVSIGTDVFWVDFESGERTLLGHVDKSNVRFNDAKCDSSGRLWIGTMGLETAPAVLEPEQGSLYSLQRAGELNEKLPKVTLSNGICWSPDDKKLYFIDSIKRAIYSFDFDVQQGSIDNRQVVVDMNGNEQFSTEELPDGMTIDASGNLWVAMYQGSRVVNIEATSGRIIQSIAIPTQLVTSACFGGDSLDQLFVTTASVQQSPDKLAGHIFKVTSTDPNFKGFKPNFGAKLVK